LTCARRKLARLKNPITRLRYESSIARKSWIGVVGYVDQNHDVTQVCTGTGKFDSLQNYLDRKRETGNLHGQAPVLWAATALLRDEK
jgi:hypothetical protein